jgi:hypothetical protein
LIANGSFAAEKRGNECLSFFFTDGEKLSVKNSNSRIQTNFSRHYKRRFENKNLTDYCFYESNDKFTDFIDEMLLRLETF